MGSREAAGTGDLICCCSVNIFKTKKNINHKIAQIFTWAHNNRDLILGHSSILKRKILGHHYIIMEIVDFNPWWETGAIDRDTASMKRRDLFPTLKESLEARFIKK